MKDTILPEDQIDVRAGKATYGQMSELGRVLNEHYKAHEHDPDYEAEAIKRLIRVLHPDTDPAITFTNIKYAREIAEAVRHWKEQEEKLLKYTPTDEEKSAGYEALTTKTGPSGVAITLAEKFGVHNGPDEVFKWPYTSVFMILYTDLERYKFQKRLSDIRENKRKSKERAGRWGRKR